MLRAKNALDTSRNDNSCAELVIVPSKKQIAFNIALIEHSSSLVKNTRDAAGKAVKT